MSKERELLKMALDELRGQRLEGTWEDTVSGIETLLEKPEWSDCPCCKKRYLTSEGPICAACDWSLMF